MISCFLKTPKNKQFSASTLNLKLAEAVSEKERLQDLLKKAESMKKGSINCVSSLLVAI